MCYTVWDYVKESVAIFLYFNYVIFLINPLIKLLSDNIDLKNYL